MKIIKIFFLSLSSFPSLGAFNYLSGVNSLSTDGHTLMSVKSPWGVKYTGSTDFDPAFAQKGNHFPSS